MALRASIISAVLSSCLLAGPVFAAETSKQQEQPDYASQKAVQAFIDDLVENEQFKRSELESIIGQAHRVDRVLELISRPSRETSDLERLSQDFYDPGAYSKRYRFLERPC